MILQSLVNYYEALAARGEISSPGWCAGNVSFLLTLSPEGELRGVIPQVHEELRGKKTVQVPARMKMPERVVRTAGVKANFLCDNTAYLLGFDDKGKPKRTRDCFEVAKTLHLSILEGCHGRAARAIKAFFETWEPEAAREHPAIAPYAADMAAATNLAFRVDGQPAQDDAEICEAWQRHSSAAGEGGARQRCLVTGREGPIARLHNPVKGVPGAQSSGASLISINATAYESYALEDMPGAPVGEYAAFAYVTALNHLLDDRAHRRQIGDTTVLYWAEQADKVLQNTFALFAFPQEDAGDKLAGILRNLSLGLPVDDVDMNRRFYVLGLAPNAARLSVRFFLQDTFGNMIEDLRRHYDYLEIQRPGFDTRQYLSVPAMLYETVNPNSRDKAASPLLSGAVMRAILTGTHYPHALFGAVMTRIRADGNVSRGRAAILKAYLIRNLNENEVTTVALNETSKNRAYVLGRLFAVLEDAQKQASPGINTTIKDRYFTSACATPGSVFPLLLKLSNYHTAKAEYGRYREIEKAALLDKLDLEQDPLPSHLALKDQGIFILGYYHQVQAGYSKHKKEETKP